MKQFTTFLLYSILCLEGTVAKAFPPQLVSFAVPTGCSTPVVVQVSSTGVNGGSSSAQISTTINGVTAGDDLIAAVFGTGQATAPTYSVSDGNSYHADIQQSFAQTGGPLWNQVGIFRFVAAAGGSHTITATSSAGAFNTYGYIVVLEASKLGAALPVVNSNGTSTGSNAPTTNAATPATSCSLAVSVASLQGQGNPEAFGHPPSGYTSASIQTNGASGGPIGFGTMVGSADYKAFTTTGAENPSYATFTSANAWTAAIAIYQGVGGGGGGGGTAKKWHTGHYMEGANITYLGNKDTNGNPMGAYKASEIAILRAGPAIILGYEAMYTWRSFYNSGTIDASSTGSGMDADYVAATGYVSGSTINAVYSSPRRFAVFIITEDFFFNTPGRVVPDYITSNSIYGTGPGGTSPYGWWTSGGRGCGGGATFAIWRGGTPSVSHEFQGFLTALANHILPDGWTMDTSPYVEWIKLYSETVANSPQDPGCTNTGDSTFSYSNEITQLEAVNTAAQTAWPHTNIASTDNWLTQAPADTLTFHATFPSTMTAMSGPDIIGGFSACGTNVPCLTWGQAAYIGLKGPSGNPYTTPWIAGGTSHIGVFPLLATIQGTETQTGGGIGPYTPIDLFNQENITLHATHDAWAYAAPSASPLAARWLGSASTITQWNTNPGNWGGVLDVLFSNSLSTNSCPSSYGSCNVN